MASAIEVEKDASDMGLPLEYVQALYDETSGKEAVADGGDDSSSPQANSESSVSQQPAEAPPTEATSGISEKLADRARAYGLDPDAFRDSDSLQNQIDAYDRQLLQSQQQQQQAPQQQPTQEQYRQQLYDQQRVAQQQAEQQQQLQQQAPQVPQFAFDLGDEYDPDEVAKFNAGLQQVAEYVHPIVGHIQQLTAVVEQQNAYIQQIQQREQAVQIEETNKAFDSAVDSLNSELFGTGRYEEVGVPEQTQRSKLMESAHTLALAYGQRGIPIPEMPDLVEQAFRLTFAEEAKKNNQAELRQKVLNRSRQRLGTGSSSKTSHVGANGKVKPYKGNSPEKDPVLLGAFAQFEAEQDFR